MCEYYIYLIGRHLHNSQLTVYLNSLYFNKTVGRLSLYFSLIFIFFSYFSDKSVIIQMIKNSIEQQITRNGSSSPFIPNIEHDYVLHTICKFILIILMIKLINLFFLN